MPKRFLTNIVVLALFGLAYFGVTSIINLTAATDVADDHEFSFVKRTAERHRENKDWKSAGRYYKELAQVDDSNSGAHLYHAMGLKRQIEPLIRKINRAKDDAEKSSATAEIEPLVEEAIDAFTETLQFGQFRNIARIQLAHLHGFSGDKKQSVEFVIAALRDGGSIKGLQEDLVFFGCEDVYHDSEVQTIIRQKFGHDLLLRYLGNRRN